jgi:HEAT repeat protein
MVGKRGFEEQVAALDALRQQPAELRTGPLHKALGAKNNFIAAKAADLVREFALEELIPDLLTAFDRFLENAEKSDPQCWAKNAISRALAALEYQEPEVFLRGMRHIQMEPVWGGRSDTAGTLRATCALALVQCRSVREPELLAHLVDLWADKDKTVRVEVARAIEQMGSNAASLLLRLRATVCVDDPELMGACCAGVLRIEGVRSIAWASRFLTAGDDSAAEAALAIAGTHSREGFEALRECLGTAKDPWFRSVLLSAIALTRQETAVDLLLDCIRKDSVDARPALEALLRSMPSEEIIERIETLVADNPRLRRVLAEQRRASK